MDLLKASFQESSKAGFIEWPEQFGPGIHALQNRDAYAIAPQQLKVIFNIHMLQGLCNTRLVQQVSSHLAQVAFRTRVKP